MLNRSSWLAALPMAAVLLACPKPPVGVELTPATASVVAGQSQVFQAKVTGTSDARVEWSVKEGSAGGVITDAGLYTAPNGPGQFTVVATSLADRSRSATALVTVLPRSGISVSVSPSTATVEAGQTVTFSAGVTGSDDVSVDWSVEEGTSAGTITAAGVYTAPQTTGTFHVLATSRADPAKSARATVVVTAASGVSVTLQPGQAAVVAGGTQQFTATVTGSSNTAVTWSVQEGAAGGSVTAAGLYTAPAQAGTFHVVATSVADPTKSAVATVAVSSTAGINVSVSPPAATVLSFRSRQFTATVTNTSDQRVRWSIDEPAGGGSISTTGMYFAGATPGTYTVRATSEADPTRSGTATVTVLVPVRVSVAPSSVTLQSGQTQQFSVSVTGTSNSAVTWSVSPAGGGTVTANGLYTAPATLGTYQVIATSVADPSSRGVASVSVLGPPTTLSGTVTYGGSKTGRIYLTLSGSSGSSGLGTSLASPGAFTLRGLQRPGTYTLRAFMDTLGNQHECAAVAPAGMAQVTFTGGAVSGVNIALADPTPLTLVAPPSPRVFPGSGAAVISLNPARDSQGRETADHYKVYWSNTASPGPSNHLGTRTISAAATPVLHLSGLTNGVPLYVSVAGVNGGTEGPLSPSVGPIAIGPAGGATLSGTVSFAGVSTAGPLVLLAAEYSSGPTPVVRSAVISNPTSPQAYSLAGVPLGTYVVYAYLDRDNDGALESTDASNIYAGGLTMVTASSGGTTTVPAISLQSGGSLATVLTSHVKTGGFDDYDVHLQVRSNEKRVVKVALSSGPGLSATYDLPMNSAGGHRYELLNLATAPSVGGLYSFDVTYADGTTATQTAGVTAVLPVATVTSPTGTITNKQPTFTWTYPAPLPVGSSQTLYVSPTGINPWLALLPGTQTSAQYNFNGLAGAASLPSGSASVTIEARDANGNMSWAGSTFTVQ